MNRDSMARRQMACLGDASRYRIVSELATGQACVTDLAGRIGLSQSCTTRHLQALVGAGLVSRQRAGRRVLFSVRTADPAVRSLLDWKRRLETDAEFRPPSTSDLGSAASADVGEDPLPRADRPGRSTTLRGRGAGAEVRRDTGVGEDVDRRSAGHPQSAEKALRDREQAPTLGAGNDRSEVDEEGAGDHRRRSYRDLEDFLL